MIPGGRKLPSGYRLICYDTIGSTNNEAKRLAADGAEDGTMVWALEQTAGRGRRARSWVSPRGNLYVSLILWPDCAMKIAAQHGFVAALALGEALRATLPGLAGLSYKWPNDVLLNGRKIAGILLETEIAEPGSRGFLVIGIGVNLVSSPPATEFPAGSLAEAGLGEVTPEAVLTAFIANFHTWKERWRAEGFRPVRTAWLRDAAGLGEPIRIRLENTTLHGRFLDIDDEGTLLLESDGGCRRIAAAEVFPTIAGAALATSVA